MLRCFSNDLHHGKEKALAEAYTSGFNVPFNKSGVKRVFAEINEPQLHTDMKNSESEYKNNTNQQAVKNKTKGKKESRRKVKKKISIPRTRAA